MTCKVFHLRSSTFFGGPEKIIFNICQGQNPTVENRVGLFSDGETKSFAKVLASLGTPVSFLQSGAAFLKELKKNPPDVLCTHDYKSNFWGWVASFSLSFRHVAVFHGRTRHSFKSRLYEGIDRFVLGRVHSIVAVSEATKAALEPFGHKVSVIPNAVSIPETPEYPGSAKEQWGLEASDLLFFTAARLSPEKNIPSMVEAFGALLDKNPNFFLFIAGDGEEKSSVESLIKSRGWESHIRLLGFIEDCAPYYAAMDAYLLFSHREGLPMALLEAASYGKPLVGPDVGGVAQLIKNGQTGILLSSPIQDELKQAIKDLAFQPEWRFSLGAQARRLVEKEFSLSEFSQAYEDVFLGYKRRDTLFLSWEHHRRSREIAKVLESPLVELVKRGSPFVRYPVLAWKTLQVLLQRQPKNLIIQCPSVVLGFLSVLLKPFFGYRLFLDSHNEVIEPYINTSWVYKKIIAFLHRHSEFSIVTNEPLSGVVKNLGGRPLILPDPLPVFPGFHSNGPFKKENSIVFICTYAPDEPFREVLAAARLLGPDTQVTLTGNHLKGGGDLTASAPSNVHFTGFLSEEDYLQKLREADVLVDLTAMENCLVCGAYEAVALEKPLVTSDTQALRSYFHRGVVYAEHTPEALAEGMRRALNQRKTLGAEMKKLKKDLQLSWGNYFQAVCSRLES